MIGENSRKIMPKASSPPCAMSESGARSLHERPNSNATVRKVQSRPTRNSDFGFVALSQRTKMQATSKINPEPIKTPMRRARKSPTTGTRKIARKMP